METVTVFKEAVELEIVIRFNVKTGEISLTGCDESPLVALGMLDYALARVRRVLGTNDVMQDARNAPRIAVAGGPLA